jgi:3D (Asp-Asp-Asp) domain-containing protein
MKNGDTQPIISLSTRANIIMFLVHNASLLSRKYKYANASKNVGANATKTFKGGTMIAKLVLLGLLQVTSYRAIPAQTKPECKDRHHCDTSIGDGITMYGVAVSQDLLRSGEVKYGDVLLVPGYGWRIVNDCMGPKARRAIDLLVFTRNQEKAVGVRHLNVYVLRQNENR